MRPFFLSCVLLATSGCTSGSGSATVEGVEPFGAVLSALWTMTPPVPLWVVSADGAGLEELGEVWFDTLNLRSYLWSCEADQAYVERRSELSEAVVAADESGDADAWCEAVTALEDHEATLPAAWQRFSASSEVVAELPEPGDVSGASGVLTYAADDGAACPRWDAATCRYEGGDETCGELDETWFVEPSRYTLAEVDDTVVAGTLEGPLEPSTGEDPVGSITVDFRATPCPVDAGAALVLTP